MVDTGTLSSRSKKLLLKRWELENPMWRLFENELEIELEKDPEIDPARPPMLFPKLPIERGSTLFISNALWRPKNDDETSDCCC